MSYEADDVYKAYLFLHHHQPFCPPYLGNTHIHLIKGDGSENTDVLNLSPRGMEAEKLTTLT